MVVAVDSSTFIAYMQGSGGDDVETFVATLRSGEIALPPVVVTELLSEPLLPTHHRQVVLNLPILDSSPPGYWVRAAATRSTLIAKKLRALLPDTLIAQSCIDHDVPLITRDRDFRHFAKHCGLKLA